MQVFGVMKSETSVISIFQSVLELHFYCKPTPGTAYNIRLLPTRTDKSNIEVTCTTHAISITVSGLVVSYSKLFIINTIALGIELTSFASMFKCIVIVTEVVNPMTLVVLIPYMPTAGRQFLCYLVPEMSIWACKTRSVTHTSSSPQSLKNGI